MTALQEEAACTAAHLVDLRPKHKASRLKVSDPIVYATMSRMVEDWFSKPQDTDGEMAMGKQ